jgi:hypothetical protein
MIRALKNMDAENTQQAAAQEMNAYRILQQQERSDNPTDNVILQFNGPTMPGGFGNIM